jgi:predicted CXXCH cytochrome family protein
MTRLKIIGGLSLAVVCAIVAGFFLKRAEPVRIEAQNRYVNPNTCAGCHPAQAKTYRQTGMGRSWFRPTPANMVEDFKKHNTFLHRASDRYYTLIERNGAYFQRRHQLGFDGAETNVIEKRIDYVVGSGNHARSYVHRTAEGKLVELPVSWYAENGGSWGMSPGFDRANHQDFRRVLLTDCVACHNAYPSPASAAATIDGDPIFGSDVPEGIDCQRCHGPGQAHAEAAGSGRVKGEELRKLIVNPARLDRDRQMDVCQQCHLETTSGPLPHMIRRFDREPFSYRPGEPLGDYALFFDHAPDQGRGDKFEIAHAASRLRQSACFQSSRMTCTTCHNPHDIPRGDAAVARYVGICRSCHTQAHANSKQAGGNCLDCHMPKRRAEDAVHVVMTDHRIQRQKPSRNLTAPLREEKHPDTYLGEVVPYYSAGVPRNREEEMYIAVAQVQQGANLEKGIPRLKAALEQSKPAGPRPYLELGRAYAKAGKPENAVPWFEAALQRDPTFQPAQRELGATLVALGQFRRAIEVLSKVAPHTSSLVNLANAYLRSGNPNGAKQALDQALRIESDLPEAHNLLGLVALQQGQAPEAEAAFRTATRIQPDLGEAHHNLGKLLAGNRDYKQADYHFTKAIAANPADAAARHSHALILLLSGATNAAMDELREVVRLDPKLAQAHNDLGDILAAKGSLDNAISEYQLAVAAEPAFAEAHLSLGLTLERIGRRNEAEASLRIAAQSSDPSIQQTAANALLRFAR